MAIVEDDETDEKPSELEDDRFQLSPIPTTATLPVSNLPNRQTFRALTAEDSDIEDLKAKRANAFMRRSIDPIQIRPSLHRMNSNNSVRDQDVTMARSIPRGSVDVHMASCSSSPNTSFQYTPRERGDDPTSSSPLTARSSARRPSVSSSSSQAREQEELQERLRAQQLRELLELPHLTQMDATNESYRPSKSHSPESSGQVSRNSSPVSHSSGSAMGPPSHPIQNTLLQRPALSRASTAAAMQAERERARSLTSKESSTPSAASQATAAAAARDRDRDREREIHTPTHPQLAPQASLYQPRRSSIGSMRGRSTTSPTGPPAVPSALTRGFWERGQQAQA